MSRKLSNAEILNRLSIKHNKQYCYIIEDIKNLHDKITIICKKHGKSNMIIWDHLNGSKCKKCSIENRKILQNKGNERFIEESIKKYTDLFNYEKVNYINNRTKVILICKLHDIEFEQLPNSHLNGNISCNGCSKIISIGEQKIRNFLISKNIKFIEQHSYDNCRNKKILKFDFFINDFNTIIEFDGIQHFEKRWNSEIEFNRLKENDHIKNNYCLENNINLIRISYKNFANIEDVINNLIKLYS